MSERGVSESVVDQAALAAVSARQPRPPMRLFIALEIPVADRNHIHRAAHPLRAVDLPVRWTHPDAYHLTLKFLGEVSAEKLPELERAMRESTPGLALTALTLLGLGGAPSLARPRVLWIDVEQSPPLMQLQSRLDSALSDLGFPFEARPFRPHITLGRIQGGRAISPADVDALRDLAMEAPTPIPIPSLALIESRLSPDGARYRVVSRIPLSPPEGLARE